jgi:hypothetical protein
MTSAAPMASCHQAEIDQPFRHGCASSGAAYGEVAVGHARDLGTVMSDPEHRHAATAEVLPQPGLDLARQLRIQVRRGLVQQHRPRLMRQRAQHGQALLLAGGQAADLPAERRLVQAEGRETAGHRLEEMLDHRVRPPAALRRHQHHPATPAVGRH